jgi:hypothetical protein
MLHCFFSPKIWTTLLLLFYYLFIYLFLWCTPLLQLNSVFAYCVNTCSWATATNSLVLATEMAYEPAPSFFFKTGEISPKI